MRRVSKAFALAGVLYVLGIVFWTASAVGAEGPTSLGQQDKVSQRVSVEDIAVRGQTVSGKVVNRLARPLRNVSLTIRSVWLWNNETNPGSDNLSTSAVYRINGEIPPGGSMPFSYSSLPAVPRSDGRYETKVFVSEFEEVP